MGYTLAQYFFTANVNVQNKTVWPPSSDILLSPTILCFIVGIISTVFSFIILNSYIFRGAEVADKWDHRRDAFMKVGGAIKIVLAAVAASTMMQNRNSPSPPFSLFDLTCNTDSQQRFIEVLNFVRGCDYQVQTSWVFNSPFAVCAL
jgi:hypothetical protein